MDYQDKGWTDPIGHANDRYFGSIGSQSAATTPEKGETPGVAAVTAGSGLSPTMQEVADRMKSHGGTITRYPGGFWCIENAAGETVHPTYGTSTVQALVRRGVAEYCDWKGNAAGRFPIKARLRDPNSDYRAPAQITDRAKQ